MTLHSGAREIRILFLGRGHTAGDVVVYLPKERMVATGDLMVNGTSYMGDAFFTDWVDTIEALKKLDIGTVLPGHGAAFTDMAKLTHWQAYVRDFWAQAQKFHKAGTPWEEAAKQVDLRGNAVNFPMIRTAGITPTTRCAGRTRFSTERLSSDAATSRIQAARDRRRGGGRRCSVGAGSGFVTGLAVSRRPRGGVRQGIRRPHRRE